MNIGVCKLQFHIPDSHSLKDKRRIVKSLIARLQNEFHVSAAEIEDQDLWQIATLGIAYVTNESQHADEVLSRVSKFVIQGYPQLEVTSYETEIVPVF